MNERSSHRGPKTRVIGATLPAILLAVSAGAAPLAERDGSVDAACPWGRLSDGKGRLLRCLSREEAHRLQAATPPAEPPGDPAREEPPPVASGTPAPPSAAPPAPPPVTPAPAPERDVRPEPAFAVEIAPIVADEGALPDALKSLRKAADRYVECVEKNGGLAEERGEVELRFLVQGRGRAEGVSVKKRKGVSELAAKCIAGVVDRRYVGYPEAPAVGATASFTVTKKKR
ncbi:MAG TPA: hypothetical protein VHE30_28100 [Polyangiaceae bacterium]|nr:hypothetical protein [Polyangiaceae bacterium]